MFFRAVKQGGETGHSLEMMGLDYLLDLNQYLDVQDALEADIQSQIDARSKSSRNS